MDTKEATQQDHIGSEYYNLSSNNHQEHMEKTIKRIHYEMNCSLWLDVNIEQTNIERGKLKHWQAYK